MKFAKPLFAASLLGACALPAMSATTNHVDGYIVPHSEIDIGPFDDEGDGFGVKGAFQVAPRIFLTGEYQGVEYDDANGDLDQLRLGADFGPGAGASGQGLYGRGQYVSLDFDGGDDQDGVGAHVGYGMSLTPALRVHGEAGYLLLDDLDGPEFLVGAEYRVAQNLGVFADYRMTRFDVDGGGDLDLDELRVGARFHF